MSKLTYHESDLEVLVGSTNNLCRLERELTIDLRCTEEAYTRIGSAAELPEHLRDYFTSAGKKLDEMHNRLSKELREIEEEGTELRYSIRPSIPLIELTDEVLDQLEHINSRLKVLEKSLMEMIEGMHSRCNGLNPASVDWDEWDKYVEIFLTLTIGPDPERPSYAPALWEEDGIMEMFQLEVRLSCAADRYLTKEKDYWGIEDGNDHGTQVPHYGQLSRDFDQCYLFHDLYDHADVGLWGILHLRSMRIEIEPRRSGCFTI
jgi:hypothetical protein